jgi:two-component system nitrogen regulation sensor histidine kinase NtrY
MIEKSYRNPATGRKEPMAAHPRKNSVPLPRDERSRRRIEFIVMVTAFAALAGGYFLERNLYRFSLDVKLPSNLTVFTLINVNLLLLLLLLFFLIRNIIKLVFERRSRVVWSKLRTRLVVAFAAFSLVPTLLLFALTTGTIKRSVEGWFKGQVDNAMRRSVEVAETYYRESQDRALHFAQEAAERLQAEGWLESAAPQDLGARIEELRRSYDLWALELYAPDFSLREASVDADAPVDISRFAFPFAGQLLSENPGRMPAIIETFAGQDLARAFVPIVSSLDGQTVIAYVVADVALQENLLQKVEMVASSYGEYWRLRQLASPLKTSYIFSLIMVFTMVMMLSTWVGLWLAKGISEPIQQLVEATHEISKGNLNVRVPPAGDDEIGRVVDSFNAMTADLERSKDEIQSANRALQAQNEQVESARRYIEIVLASVAAGVISFDRDGNVRTMNANAADLLGIKAEEALGRNFRGVFHGEFLALARELMATLREGTRSLQRQWTMEAHGERLTLLVNFTAMQAEDGALIGAVLVFDDLSELVKAQQAAAWREVARRVAHEIKNPLTPIQLSAQRLRKRYLAKFDENDSVFDESTRVIIEQVEAMKALVNEFSQFARMPDANLAPQLLNPVVEEIASLYRQAHPQVTIHFSQAPDLPPVNIDAEQIKRAVINLLDNAVAAVEGGQGEITVRTGLNPELRIVSIEVRDTGPGIPGDDRQRIFEPYFTTKANGTGLGLPIVRKIMEDHRGYVRVQSNSPRGAVFVLELPLAEAPLREIA